ncbi:MAG: ATP-dependent helicase, partial [Hoeflea sp.]
GKKETTRGRGRRGGRSKDKAAAKPAQEAAPKAETTEKTDDSGPQKTAKSEEKPARRERGGRGRDRDRDDDQPVVGLGDHVPAFILRAVKLPKKNAKEADDELETESEDA